MPARVDYAGVLEIFNTDLEQVQVERFITMANLLVDQYLLDLGYSEPLLTEIERNLAAHFAASSDPVAESFQIAAEYTEKRTGQWGMFLKSTPYGQTAVTLDSSGKLSSLGNKRATFAVHSEYD